MFRVGPPLLIRLAISFQLKTLPSLSIRVQLNYGFLDQHALRLSVLVQRSTHPCRPATLQLPTPSTSLTPLEVSTVPMVEILLVLVPILHPT
jgi:hypothetical protein